MRTLTQKLDGLAVSFSVICLLHCLLLPVSVTLLPIIGLPLSHGAFHQLLLVVVLPTSLFALGLGCRRHRSRSVAWLGGLGMGLLILAAFAVDSVWGHALEREITIAGGIILALAHIQNFRVCRKADCADHCH